MGNVDYYYGLGIDDEYPDGCCSWCGSVDAKETYGIDNFFLCQACRSKFNTIGRHEYDASD